MTVTSKPAAAPISLSVAVQGQDDGQIGRATGGDKSVERGCSRGCQGQVVFDAVRLAGKVTEPRYEANLNS